MESPQEPHSAPSSGNATDHPKGIDSKHPAWSREDLNANPHIAVDKATRVEAMFTSIARSYDLNNRLHSLWQDQVWRHRAVAMAQLCGNEDVVDVACGTGDLSMAFWMAGVQSVLGIDFTQAMLDVAISKAKIAALPITYQQGDAMNLVLEDSSADVVSIAFGIRNVQDPSKALSEFFRILKPNGRLIVLEFSTPANPILRVMHDFYTKRIMPITATLISRDTSGAYKYLPKSVATFSDPLELAACIKEAGFNSVTQQSETFGVCTITRAIKGE